MPPVQPSASVAATGLGIRYVGTDPMFVYAFSGLSNGTGAFVDVLDFTSGVGVINAQYQLTADWDGIGSDQLFIDLYFNEVQLSRERANINSGEGPHLNRPYYVIIPPLTRFRLAIKTDSTASRTGIFFSGRVYGAE